MTSSCWPVRVAIATVVAFAAPLACAAASCDALDPCAAKACRIDVQIAQAKAKGNTRQLASLERARGEMVHGSDEGLKQKRRVSLEQAQRRIDQRSADLKKAQRKLDSARKAYSEIESSPL